MSYAKHNFQSGGKLYASQLNNMDDQIALNDERLSSIEGEGISAVVDEWLEDNFSNPDSPPLDRTLSSSSSAAPADLVGDIRSSTKNIWDNGDVIVTDSSGESSFLLKTPIPAGTYTISCECTSTHTGHTYSMIRFSKAKVVPMGSETFIADCGILHDGVRTSYTFTLLETAYTVRFLSGTTQSNSSGKTSNWTNIQLESGSSATAYVPHATATDYIARSSVVIPFSNNSPVNVLLFGVKNDGSEDISPLVNELTEHYPLYFPAGIYKVSSQIVLKHSIYGAGLSRYNQVDANYTWFVSEINNPTTPTTSVFKIESNRTESITGINIMLNSYENGIDVYYNQIYTKIESVNISNIRGHGIFGYRTSDQSTGSRLLFINDISLFGASDYPTISTGIKFSSQIGDCRITNAEIMGLKIGIELGNGIIYMSNVHVWCGPLAGIDDGSWWSETVGIRCSQGNRLLATNLYLDTCYHGIETLGAGGSISIHNFMYAEDASASESELDDSVLIHMVRNFQRVTIDGGFVNFRGGVETPCKLKRFFNLNNPNLKITDVISVGDYPIDIDNADKFNQNSLKTDYALVLSAEESNEYVEIAHFPIYNVDACMHLEVVEEDGTCDMRINVEGTTVTIDADNNSNADFFYKFDGTSGLIIYEKKTLADDETTHVYIDRVSNGTVFANYSFIRRRTPNAEGTNEYVRDVLSSANGLTSIV